MCFFTVTFSYPSLSDRLFRCRFNTSKFIRRQGSGSKLTLVRARCLSLPPSLSSYWSSNPVWMCSCSPLEPRTPYPASPKNPLLTPPPDQSFFLACFHSRHARDMKLLDAQDRYSLYESHFSYTSSFALPAELIICCCFFNYCSVLHTSCTYHLFRLLLLQRQRVPGL